ncbi:MAG: hypothetical protein ACTSW1_01785 [Candidatus Hodarchaeales archaeon]
MKTLSVFLHGVGATLILFTLLIFFPSFSTTTLVQGASNLTEQSDPSVIVVDISHGYEVYIPAKASVMGGLLEGTGDFEVRSTQMKTPITADILADADAFVIVCPDTALNYSTDEISVLKNFMNNGGSILFVGAPQTWRATGDPGMDSSELNRVISELKLPVSFLRNSPYYCKTDLSGSLPSHDTMAYLNSFYMQSAPLIITNTTYVEVVTQGTRSGSNYDSFAVFDNGTHRAAFIGSISVLLEHRVYRDGGYDDDLTYVDDGRGDDHYQFQYNLMRWLSRQTPKQLGEYLPIKVYTGIDSTHDPQWIRSLEYYQGVFHFHTEKSTVNAPIPDLVSNFEILGHSWVAPTDYNIVAGGPAMREYVNSHGSDLVIIDGEEATGLGQYHTTGLFAPNNATDIYGVLNPNQRIELFHNQSSPCFLAHPSWLFYPDETYRVWDHDIYPFDGYEVVNTGFLQGCGNLASYPFYGAVDSHSAELWDMGTVWDYVFAEEPPSEDPNWLINAIFDRRVVIYSHLGDYYFGDKLLVDEVIGRINGEITITPMPTTTTTSTTNTTDTLSSTGPTTNNNTSWPSISLLLISLVSLYGKKRQKH